MTDLLTGRTIVLAAMFFVVALIVLLTVARERR